GRGGAGRRPLHPRRQGRGARGARGLAAGPAHRRGGGPAAALPAGVPRPPALLRRLARRGRPRPLLSPQLPRVEGATIRAHLLRWRPRPHAQPHREYVSRAAVARRLIAGPFSSPTPASPP